MVISHYGFGFVKIQQGDTIIAVNPHKDGAKFGSDIALVSLNDPNYNATNLVTYGERVPFLVNGPGEYEIREVFIQGWNTAGPGDKINTVYLLIVDGIRLVHLGALSLQQLPADAVEEMGVVDVLFAPVTAGKLVTELEPKLIIPVNFDDKTLATFLKEYGEGDEKPVESLQLKRKDLSDKQAAVTVVKSY